MIRFATTVSQSYIPALLALLNSVKQNSQLTDIHFDVVNYDCQSLDILKTQDIPCTVHDLCDLGGFPCDGLKSMSIRQVPNLQKLCILNLPIDETLIYLDADMLCLNPLTGIQDLKPFGVAVNNEDIGKRPGENNAYTNKTLLPFNTGFMVFRPDAQEFHEIAAFARKRYQKHRLKYADQVILNDWRAEKSHDWLAQDQVNWVSPYWNMSMWTKVSHPWLWQPELIRFLHFTGDAKPWDTGKPIIPRFKQFWQLWQVYKAC